MPTPTWPFGANPRVVKNHFALVLGIVTILFMIAGLIDFWHLGSYKWVDRYFLSFYTILLWPYVGLKEWARYRRIDLDQGIGQLFPWAWFFYVLHMIVAIFFFDHRYQIQPDIFWMFGQSWLSYGFSLIFKIEEQARLKRMLTGQEPFDKDVLPK